MKKQPRPPHRWSADEWRRARQLRTRGLSFGEIGDELGLTGHQVQVKFGNEAYRLRLERGEPLRHFGDPSPAALADRERRLAATPSLTAHLCGDPRPGQSALDKKRNGQTA